MATYYNTLKTWFLSVAVCAWDGQDDIMIGFNNDIEEEVCGKYIVFQVGVTYG